MKIKPNELLNTFNMPVGTEYDFFDKSKHLVVGNYVYASKFAGKEIGEITGLMDDQICLVNGRQTFISDIQYIRL